MDMRLAIISNIHGYGLRRATQYFPGIWTRFIIIPEAAFDRNMDTSGWLEPLSEFDPSHIVYQLESVTLDTSHAPDISELIELLYLTFPGARHVYMDAIPSANIGNNVYINQRSEVRRNEVMNILDSRDVPFVCYTPEELWDGQYQAQEYYFPNHALIPSDFGYTVMYRMLLQFLVRDEWDVDSFRPVIESFLHYGSALVTPGDCSLGRDS